MKYKNIIFDIDGTLINSDFYSVISLQEMLYYEHNKFITIDDLLQVNDLSVKEIVSKFQIDEMLWDKYYEKYLSNIRTFNNIEKVLQTLHNKKYFIGIVTSRSRNDYKEFQNFSISKYINYVICCDDAKETKPSPCPIKTLLKSCNKNNVDTLYIGDSFNDMISANRANVDFALAMWNTVVRQFDGAKYYLYDAQDLLNLLGE